MHAHDGGKPEQRSTTTRPASIAAGMARRPATSESPGASPSRGRRVDLDGLLEAKTSEKGATLLRYKPR
jgi:hypothetical protein